MRAWFELKPFHVESEDAGTENMNRIIDHVDRLLFVAYRDGGGVIRVYVRADESYAAVLSTLDGTELVRSPDGPDLKGLRYTGYSMKRHCALPVAPKNMAPASVYRVLAKTSGRAFLSLYMRRTQPPHPVRRFISMLDAGRNPESLIDGLIGAMGSQPKTAKRSALKAEKIRIAREKIATRNLFLCRMAVGVTAAGDEAVIRAVFPSGAFRGKRIAEKRLGSMIRGGISVPMFGGDRSLVLNDEELHSFLTLPSNRDISEVEFDLGRMSSSSSGLVEGAFGGADGNSEVEGGGAENSESGIKP